MMAIRDTRGPLRRALDAVVSSPPRATLTVGASIVTLMLLIEVLSSRWPSLRILRFVVPFMPPFVITRAARAIAERKSSHEFISDAVPYVFVAFPEAATASALMSARPSVMSDASSEHLGLPMDRLFDLEPMPKISFVDPSDRERVVLELLSSFERDGHRGTVSALVVQLRRGDVAVPYLVTTALTRMRAGLKWQGALMELARSPAPSAPKIV